MPVNWAVFSHELVKLAQSRRLVIRLQREGKVTHRSRQTLHVRDEALGDQFTIADYPRRGGLDDRRQCLGDVRQGPLADALQRRGEAVHRVPEVADDLALLVGEFAADLVELGEDGL